MGARTSGGSIESVPSRSMQLFILFPLTGPRARERARELNVEVPQGWRSIRPAPRGGSSMAVSHASVGTPSDDIWIYNRKFDLVFLTLSGALVFLPYLSYGLLQRLGASTATASLIIGLAVTLLVGGPHMYSTYLRTALEPRFRARYGFLAYLPMLVIPVLVIPGAARRASRVSFSWRSPWRSPS